MLKSEPQAYRVASIFFRVTGEMRRLPDYFDNSESKSKFFHKEKILGRNKIESVAL